MPKRKQYKYRELLKKLRDHDGRFEERPDRCKGSERLLYHPDVTGKPRSYVMTCHSEGHNIRAGHLSAIIRRFELPSDFFNS